ncbi:MAG: hypothetical protein ABF802_06235 [Acetobacter orientalis]
MPTIRRHNFSAAVRKTLALRAAHFCSNPRCLKLTAGPAHDGECALETGHGAHICAAAPGGPRYDPDQSASERSGAANGIWLCRECGDIVDKDHEGYSAEKLLVWKRNHEAMIAEVRTQGWARSIELLRAQRRDPKVAAHVIALFEDRRVFWAAFDAEMPDRVRRSLDGLRRDLTALRGRCVLGSPLDTVIVALGMTIRHFYDAVERFDLDTLRCDSHDPEWCAFEMALRTLRKSIGYQLDSLGRSYDIPLQGEFVSFVPQAVVA